MPLRRHLLAGAAFLATLPAPVHDAGAQAVKVRLGTATPGGGFPVYGAAFIEAVRRVDPGLEIEAINTKGSTENVPMLEAGTLDIALVQGEVVHEVAERHRPAAGRSADHHGDVSHRRHVRGAGRFPLPPHRRPFGQAGRLGRARLGPGDSRPLRHGRAGARCGEGLPADLSRTRGRWAGDGARRPRRRAVGRRRRLARLHDGGQERAGRALHRARRPGDRPHPGQASRSSSR